MIEIKRPTILPPPSLVLLSFSFLSSFPLCLVSSPSFLDSGKAHVCAWCVPSCQSQDSNRVIEHMGSPALTSRTQAALKFNFIFGVAEIYGFFPFLNLPQFFIIGYRARNTLMSLAYVSYLLIISKAQDQ